MENNNSSFMDYLKSGAKKITEENSDIVEQIAQSAEAIDEVPNVGEQIAKFMKNDNSSSLMEYLKSGAKKLNEENPDVVEQITQSAEVLGDAPEVSKQIIQQKQAEDLKEGEKVGFMQTFVYLKDGKLTAKNGMITSGQKFIDEAHILAHKSTIQWIDSNKVVYTADGNGEPVVLNSEVVTRCYYGKLQTAKELTDRTYNQSMDFTNTALLNRLDPNSLVVSNWSADNGYNFYPIPSMQDKNGRIFPIPEIAVISNVHPSYNLRDTSSNSSRLMMFRTGPLTETYKIPEVDPFNVPAFKESYEMHNSSHFDMGD